MNNEHVQSYEQGIHRIIFILVSKIILALKVDLMLSLNSNSFEYMQSHISFIIYDNIHDGNFHIFFILGIFFLSIRSHHWIIKTSLCRK